MAFCIGTATPAYSQPIPTTDDYEFGEGIEDQSTDPNSPPGGGGPGPRDGQCLAGGCTGGANFPTGTFTTTSSTFVTVATNIFAGEYAIYSVTSGQTYEWTTCAADGGVASYDTQLTLRNAAGTAAICYSDDFCGAQSKILWTATLTGTVRVLLNQYNCATNSISTTVRWRCASCGPSGPANNACASFVTVGPGAVSQAFTTVGATSDGPADCATNQDIWYRYTPTCTARYRVSLCGAGYDSHLSAYASAVCPPTGLVGCNDDNGPGCSGTASSLDLDLTGGTTYTIRVGGFSGNTGTGTLTINPVNNLCANATALSGASGSATGSTVGSTNDGTATCASSTTSPDVWYAWTAPACGYLTVETCSAATFDTGLSVLTGACPGTQVACDDDACGAANRSRILGLPVLAGTAYRFRVAGFSGATGCFTLSWALSGVAAPSSPSATPPTVCPGQPTTLSASVASGETVDWFTGSCGGTPAGNGTSLVVSPASTTTYFARARNVTTACVSTSCSQVTVTAADTQPPVLTCGPAISVHAAAGGCTATVNWSAAGVADNCTTGLTAVYDVDVDDNGSIESANQSATSYTFPGGTHRVTAKATDAAGNPGTCAFLVTVSASNVLVAAIQLLPVLHDPNPGVGGNEITRCISFTLRNCPVGITQTVTQVIRFSADDDATNGMSLNAIVLLPCGLYSCITAEDALHTLRRRIDTAPHFAISGTQYTADFSSVSRRLIQGNLLHELSTVDVVDILDFGVLISTFGTSPGASTTCLSPYPNADIDGDGTVFSGDFTFISNNFFAAGDPACCESFSVSDGGGPEVAVTIAELRARGLGWLENADLNGDSLLDVFDVIAFWHGVRPTRPPADAPNSAPVDAMIDGGPAKPASPPIETR